MIRHGDWRAVTSAGGPRRRRNLLGGVLRLALVTATVGALMVAAAATPAAATTTTPAQILQPPGFVNDVACASATTCYAVGQTQFTPSNPGGAAIWTVTNGVAGTAYVLAPGYGLSEVVCYDATTCVAYGGFKPPGTPRSFPTQPIRIVITNGVIGMPENTPYTLNNVDCFTAAYCVGVTSVEQNGVPHLAVVVLTNGVFGTPQVVPAQVQSLEEVACASATACYAVGQTPPDPAYPDPFFGEPQNIGVVLPVINGVIGTPQVAPLFNTLYSVGCASTSTCYAVGPTLPTADNFFSNWGLVTIVNGVPTQTELAPSQFPPFPDVGALTGIDCMTAAICEAVGFDNNGAGVVIPVINGVFGEVHPVEGSNGLQGVACSAPNCVAIGSFNPPAAASVGVITLITEPELMCNGQAATMIGTAGPNKLFGTSGADVILGLAGDDSIYGYGGDDSICAGAGNDVVYGGSGNDFVEGGAGRDTINGEAGNDDLRGDADSDRIFAGAGNDQINGGPAVDYCYKGTGTTTFTACEVFPAGM